MHVRPISHGGLANTNTPISRKRGPLAAVDSIAHGLVIVCRVWSQWNCPYCYLRWALGAGSIPPTTCHPHQGAEHSSSLDKAKRLHYGQPIRVDQVLSSSTVVTVGLSLHTMDAERTTISSYLGMVF